LAFSFLSSPNAFPRSLSLAFYLCKVPSLVFLNRSSVLTRNLFTSIWGFPPSFVFVPYLTICLSASSLVYASTTLPSKSSLFFVVQFSRFCSVVRSQYLILLLFITFQQQIILYYIFNLLSSVFEFFFNFAVLHNYYMQIMCFIVENNQSNFGQI
jgi:hypothetical protein